MLIKCLLKLIIKKLYRIIQQHFQVLILKTFEHILSLYVIKIFSNNSLIHIPHAIYVTLSIYLFRIDITEIEIRYHYLGKTAQYLGKTEEIG